MIAHALMFVATGSLGGSALLFSDYRQHRRELEQQQQSATAAPADAWQDHEVLPVIVP